MSEYKFGRAVLSYKSGKISPPCSNCGKTDATMYELNMSKEVGDTPHLELTLCVICRCHLEGLFNKHTKDWDAVLY